MNQAPRIEAPGAFGSLAYEHASFAHGVEEGFWTQSAGQHTGTPNNRNGFETTHF